MIAKNLRFECLLGLAFLAFTSTADSQGVRCGMEHAFDQVNLNVRGAKTPIWADRDGNLMFIASLNVNTDGTKKSYSVSDFWGETSAINNLCNAMRDGCQGLGSAGKAQRRAITQAASAAGWPKDQLAATKLSPSIIPMPNGKPCPEVDGYLVSATALTKKPMTDQCDLSSYVDALSVPALVIPSDPDGVRSEFSKRDVRVGDLNVAIAVDSHATVPAVVGDTGPSNKLGEGSVAMNMRLLGRTDLPANYAEAKRLSGVRAFILIFGGSRDTKNPYITVDRIDPEVNRRFVAWGGNDRALACMSEYSASTRNSQ